MKKVLRIIGSVENVNEFEYDVRDEPTLLVQGSVTSVDYGVNWAGDDVCTVTYSVRGFGPSGAAGAHCEGCGNDDGPSWCAGTIAPEKAPELVRALSVGRSNVRAVWGFVWPFVVYVGGVAVGYGLR